MASTCQASKEHLISIYQWVTRFNDTGNSKVSYPMLYAKCKPSKQFKGLRLLTPIQVVPEISHKSKVFNGVLPLASCVTLKGSSNPFGSIKSNDLWPLLL